MSLKQNLSTSSDLFVNKIIIIKMILITIPLLQFHLHQSYIGITECSGSLIYICARELPAFIPVFSTCVLQQYKIQEALFNVGLHVN